MFNGVAIPGATDSSYSISTVTPAQAGNYQVVVTSPYDSTTSLPACLAVNELPHLESDLVLEAPDFRVLNAAGAEIWSAVAGTAVTLEVRVRNGGFSPTPEGVLVQVFRDGAPADLQSYDLSGLVTIASGAIAGIAAGDAAVLLLPWTVTGPEGITRLAAVAEYGSNRAQSQANTRGGSPVALPTLERSFHNNVAARPMLVGTLAGQYGIRVNVNWPGAWQSGQPNQLTGTAVYDWTANLPALGAQVTVYVGGTAYATRTVSPDGGWGVALNSLAPGDLPVSVQVTDSFVAGASAGTVRVVPPPGSGGPAPFRDLRVVEMSFDPAGVYRMAANAGWAVAGSHVYPTARVRNDGNLAADAFQVAFLAPDGSMIGQGAVSGLGGGQEVWVACPASWTAAALGDATLQAVADCGSVIIESNEGNNRGAAVLHARIAKPDLFVVSVSCAPSAPKQGDAVDFTARLRNLGGAALAAGTHFNVAFAVDGAPLPAVPVTLASALPNGAELTVSGTWDTSGTSPGLRRPFGRGRQRPCD